MSAILESVWLWIQINVYRRDHYCPKCYTPVTQRHIIESFYRHYKGNAQFGIEEDPEVPVFLDSALLHGGYACGLCGNRYEEEDMKHDTSGMSGTYYNWRIELEKLRNKHKAINEIHQAEWKKWEAYLKWIRESVTVKEVKIEPTTITGIVNLEESSHVQRPFYRGRNYYRCSCSDCRK